MNRLLCGVVLGLAVTAVGLAQDSAGDLKAMQGAWLGRIAEIGGVEPDNKIKEFQPKVVIKGDAYTTFLGDMKIEEGKMKLDATKKPKAIDATPKDGKFKGMTLQGLYEIKGDDMRVVFGKPGGERPKEFKTAKDSEEILIEYKRTK